MGLGLGLGVKVSVRVKVKVKVCLPLPLLEYRLAGVILARAENLRVKVRVMG